MAFTRLDTTLHTTLDTGFLEAPSIPNCSNIEIGRDRRSILHTTLDWTCLAKGLQRVVVFQFWAG